MRNSDLTTRDLSRPASPPAGPRRGRVERSLLVRGLRVPAVERRLVLEAVIALAAARLTLSLLPFPRALARLGLRQRQGQGEGVMGPMSATDAAPIAAIALAIDRATRVAPFRAVCLPQACAAVLMLRRRGLSTEVHLGVAARPAEPLGAHAWSVCRGIVVTGASARPGHAPIAVFTS
jgi:hypothetical protein